MQTSINTRSRVIRVEALLFDSLSYKNFKFWIIIKHFQKNIYVELTKSKPLIGAISASSPFYFHIEEKRTHWGKRGKYYTFLSVNFSCVEGFEKHFYWNSSVLDLNQASVTQEYLKCLATHSIRSKLWAQVLGSEVFPWVIWERYAKTSDFLFLISQKLKIVSIFQHREYFSNLEQLVGRYDMLVDKLIFKVRNWCQLAWPEISWGILNLVMRRDSGILHSTNQKIEGKS